MTRSEYLERIFNMFNEGKIDEETYDHMLMMADEYSEEEQKGGTIMNTKFVLYLPKMTKQERRRLNKIHPSGTQLQMECVNPFYNIKEGNREPLMSLKIPPQEAN